MTSLDLVHGSVRLPAFLPDATYGFVRAVDAGDLEACGIEAVVMNVFHLMKSPGSSTISALGGLHAMAEEGLDIAAFEAAAEREDGIYSDHLRRMRTSLVQNPELCDAVRAILNGQPCPSSEAFFRLQSSGVTAGQSATLVGLRCSLYEHYLARHLP